MTPLFKFNKNYDLSDYTLLFPCVAVGNVPQLTIDLLIKNLGMEKAAIVWHPGIVPVVGMDNNEICTACELYINPVLKLAAVQLRSALEFNLVTKFFEDLAQSLNAFKLRKIILLSSGFDYELRVITDKYYYISNDDVGGVMESNNVRPMKKNENDNYYINGGGFTAALYKSLSAMKTTVLVKYVSEGDNVPDAISMMEKLATIITFKFSRDSVKIPSSWRHLFGGPPPTGIF